MNRRDLIGSAKTRPDPHSEVEDSKHFSACNPQMRGLTFSLLKIAEKRFYEGCLRRVDVAPDEPGVQDLLKP